eukprot:1380161-Pyramimonas_sp.AAC.1
MGLPWKLVLEGETMRRAVVIEPGQRANLPSPAQSQEEQAVVHRRMYILQKDIAKYGCSVTCMSRLQCPKVGSAPRCR